MKKPYRHGTMTYICSNLYLVKRFEDGNLIDQKQVLGCDRAARTIASWEMNQPIISWLVSNPAKIIYILGGISVISMLTHYILSR